MAIKKVNDTSLASVADAIRAKGNTISGLYFPDGFVDAIEALDLIDDIFIKKKRLIYSNQTGETLNQFTFYGTNVTNLDMPALKTINVSALANTPRLENLRLDNLEAIYQDGFRGSGLTELVAPKLTTIGPLAFYDCRNYTGDLDFPLCTSIGNEAFVNMFAARDSSVNLPLVTDIPYAAFSGSYFNSINIPSVSNLGNSAFNGTYVYSELRIPAGVSEIGTSVFRAATINGLVFEGQAPDITGSQPFAYCRCKTIDFSNSASVPRLTTSSAFTGMTNTYIVVPDELYDEWIGATNWTAISNLIVKKSEQRNLEL